MELNERDSAHLEKDDLSSAFKKATSSNNAFRGIENFGRACRPSYNLNLREFLSLSVNGKFILRTYQRENSLTYKTRNMLVDMVMNSLIQEHSG